MDLFRCLSYLPLRGVLHKHCPIKWIFIQLPSFYWIWMRMSLCWSSPRTDMSVPLWWGAVLKDKGSLKMHKARVVQGGRLKRVMSFISSKRYFTVEIAEDSQYCCPFRRTFRDGQTPLTLSSSAVGRENLEIGRPSWEPQYISFSRKFPRRILQQAWAVNRDTIKKLKDLLFLTFRPSNKYPGIISDQHIASSVFL